ncbi:hypothetical protein A3K73_02395 [Candidatus Pacearchaeota archaeon RBG_13_36_9]|nr:MAG: hypothetical protein A3K73_02395 [Candidatus Pacearchaeota archaeon RBG_13_36_9]
MALTSCENLRKSEVKKGDLVVRVKPDTNTISLTYFSSFGDSEDCRKGHFLAGSETVEINLNNSPPTYRRWDKQVLPRVQYSISHKYGGLREVYFGAAGEVLETLRALNMAGVGEIGEKVLPDGGLSVIE